MSDNTNLPDPPFGITYPELRYMSLTCGLLGLLVILIGIAGGMRGNGEHILAGVIVSLVGLGLAGYGVSNWNLYQDWLQLQSEVEAGRDTRSAPVVREDEIETQERLAAVE